MEARMTEDEQSGSPTCQSTVVLNTKSNENCDSKEKHPSVDTLDDEHDTQKSYWGFISSLAWTQ